MKRTPAVMILGTASSAGKSTVVAALCRIFADMGIDVAPFKSQNMSLNSAATPDGREIGRAQALQAEAARKLPSVEMNPVLIKPSSDTRAQVVVEGRIWQESDAWTYHRRQTQTLFPRVIAAYERLAHGCALVVLEGAGSPAEINLKDRDIVNLRMAAAAGARCVLVADIDRGGAFASLVGTFALLDPEERALIAGFALNKFRGDASLLDSAIADTETRLGIPCLGVIPWIHALQLDDEDGFGIERVRGTFSTGGNRDRALRVAVLELPYLANATDFDALAAEPSVELRWVADPVKLEGCDAAIVPGSKHTLHDLRWLRERGLARAITEHASTKPVLGICGGMQMLGTGIADPSGIEGGGSESGLGLLRLDTEFAPEKVTVRVRGRLAADDLFGNRLACTEFAGYEIHTGRSHAPGAQPFARIERESSGAADDGCIGSSGNVVGTYVHGLFDVDAFRWAILDALRARAGLAPSNERCAFAAERERRIDRLAETVRTHLDAGAVLGIAGYR